MTIQRSSAFVVQLDVHLQSESHAKKLQDALAADPRFFVVSRAERHVQFFTFRPLDVEPFCNNLFFPPKADAPPAAPLPSLDALSASAGPEAAKEDQNSIAASGSSESGEEGSASSKG